MESLILDEGRSIPFIIFTVLAIALGFLYRKWQRHTAIRNLKQRHGCKDPPKYPHEDKAWGSDMVRARSKAIKEGTFFKLYDAHFAQYGRTFEEVWRGKRLINTIEPVNAQQVAALASQDYAKDPERLGAQAPFMGPSIFWDGPIWKYARGMVKPIFARAELSDLDHLASYADRFLELLPDDGSELDMRPLLQRLSRDVSMDFIFGKSLGFLQREVPAEATEFITAYLKAQSWVVKRREAGWLQYRIYRYLEGKEYKDAYTKVHKYVDEQVARALRETEDEKPPGPDGPPVRKRYVLLDEMAKQIRDPIKLRYHVIAVFLPGRDATGIAVGNMLFQLARHPHLWTKLRKTALALGDTPLTFETLKSLVDFRYVYQETLRTVGPAGRVWRVAIRDTVLPSGGGPDHKSPVFVARGTPVVVVTRAMGHDKHTWGEDTDEFKPERWSGLRPIWDFIPFWGGPRICPAQQQVFTHSVYLLVRLTQKFERIENCDPVHEYVEKVTSSVESMNGIKVALKLP